MRKKYGTPAEKLLDLNIRTRARARAYLVKTTWSPMEAALLLSGILPSARWKPPMISRRNGLKPISYSDVFDELRASMSAPEGGLDDEMVFPQSQRFDNAHNVLVLWDQICAAGHTHLVGTAPKDYVALLLHMSRENYVWLPESRWLNAFANQFQVIEPYALTDIPRDILNQLEAQAGKKPLLMPKHKLGRFVEDAWNQSTSTGGASTDPDAVLTLLAAMIEENKISGVYFGKGYSYSHGADLHYIHDKEERTIKRESLARQLRRVCKKIHQNHNTGAPTERFDEGHVPFIRKVRVNENIINKLTDPSQLNDIARELLMEVVQHLRRVCIRSEGWDRARAIVVGAIVRLTKLLSTLYMVAASQTPGMITLIGSMAIETIADIKYLIKEFNADLIDKYVRYSVQDMLSTPGDWGDLSSLQRAMAIELKEEFRLSLAEMPRFVHGSLGDSYKFHLCKTENGRYHAILLGIDAEPRVLLSMGTLALSIVEDFLPFNHDHPEIKELRISVVDLFDRLKRADLLFAASLRTGR
ncbi:hypothetical protein [Trinickia dinghuensis]|uniref:Uncharacterized protein n=1 Tax=Trinickia dinghuensis TaxID=2291023 RepID=A0A3D8JZ23_9BURK|nr:hypothetical protein [Trinickia dinghuensis]RDU98298.1 hypothetical protein DWV00_13345 [Trinickia dinghuensis]